MAEQMLVSTAIIDDDEALLSLESFDWKKWIENEHKKRFGLSIVTLLKQN